MNFHKGCSSGELHSLLSAEPILSVTPGLLLVHFLRVIFHTVHPDTVTIEKVLT